MKYRCPRFDVHDQELIQNARITGHPEHIATAINVAVAGFKERLMQLPNGFPVVDGRPALLIKKPGNFFDEYVIKLVLQEIADATGKIVDLYKTGDDIKTNHSASPDIKFD